MLYDYIVESSNLLLEELLMEDRMVKYDGDIAPKFGWCVIYVGGPASGKGTATKYLSRLQGRYYNVDDLKEIERMWNIKDPKTGRPHSDNFKTPSEIVPKLDKEGNQVYDKKTGEPVYYDKYRNMGNPEFVSELHYEMKPLGKKWKKAILNNPEDAQGRERLPNIIFDITGDEVEKIMEIVDSLKPVGYKIAVIWILSTIEKALRNNEYRDRTVDPDTVFFPKHKDVIAAQEALFESGLISQIDEFWVIDSAIEINPHAEDKGVSAREYHDAQNVYHIPCTPDGLKYFEEIANRIEYNKKEITRLQNKI